MQIRSILIAAGFAALPLHAEPLTFAEALHIGEAQSPRLAAQRSLLESASQQVGRAAELPDPKLRVGIENLPVNGPDKFRYDRDFMTMRSVALMQEIPNSAKRAARNERAERLRDVERAQVAANRAALRRDIALAWMELYYAEKQRDALERLIREYRVQIDALPASIQRGVHNAAEGYALRQAFEQANDRAIEQQRAIEKARIALASFIGDAPSRRALGAPPDTARLQHAREHLIAKIDEHPDLRVFEDREALARAEVGLAQSEKKPDWSVEVGYAQRRPAFDNMISVMFAFELPWQSARRQDRDIASRLAEVEQARSLREDARRTHEAQVRGYLADLETAEQRIERFERVLKPLAREREAAAIAAYQGGRGELGQALEATRASTEVEIAFIQMLAERARAWANLNFLYGEEEERK